MEEVECYDLSEMRGTFTMWYVPLHLPAPFLVQTLMMRNVRTSQYFTLTFEAGDGTIASTLSILFSGTAATTQGSIQSNLRALCLAMPQLCAVVVTVGANPNSTYVDFVVTFPSAVGDVKNLRVDDSLIRIAATNYLVRGDV